MQGGVALSPMHNCCATCLAHPSECVGFVVYQGVCYLKSGTAGGSVTLTDLPDRTTYLLSSAWAPSPPPSGGASRRSLQSSALAPAPPLEVATFQLTRKGFSPSQLVKADLILNNGTLGTRACQALVLARKVPSSIACEDVAGSVKAHLKAQTKVVLMGGAPLAPGVLAALSSTSDGADSTAEKPDVATAKATAG